MGVFLFIFPTWSEIFRWIGLVKIFESMIPDSRKSDGIIHRLDGESLYNRIEGYFRIYPTE